MLQLFKYFIICQFSNNFILQALQKKHRMVGWKTLLSLWPWHPLSSQITHRIQLCHPGRCPKQVRATVWCGPLCLVQSPVSSVRVGSYTEHCIYSVFEER